MRPERHPPGHEARRLGCSCEWWGGGAIIAFDPHCVLLDEHKGVPTDPVDLFRYGLTIDALTRRRRRDA